MPSRIVHLLDTAVVSGSTIVAAASTMLLAADGASNAVELQMFLLPFIGALVASGGVIMLNPQPEVRQIVIGRGIFALFFGVLLPQVFPMIHPALQPFALKPAILVLMGGGVSTLAYVLSKPFCRELYQRAEGIAKREADKLEIKYSNPNPNPNVNSNPDSKL